MSVSTTLRPFKLLVHYARRAVTRALHGRRRRRALSALRRKHPTRRVMFVCDGNICRSPYAAARLRTLLGTTPAAFGVDCAGLLPGGRQSPDTAQEVAARRGIDLDTHRSVRVNEHSIAEAGIIFVMTPAQKRLLRRRFGPLSRKIVLLGDLDPRNTGERGIRDPNERPADVFYDVYDRIDRCVEAAGDALRLPERSVSRVVPGAYTGAVRGGARPATGGAGARVGRRRKRSWSVTRGG